MSLKDSLISDPALLSIRGPLDTGKVKIRINIIAYCIAHEENGSEGYQLNF